MMVAVDPHQWHVLQEKGTVTRKESLTKKEIVKQIADEIEETQLKTKEIVQLTFNAIVDTLIRDRRIELRNFGVFEVRLRKVEEATAADVLWCDGLALGSPTNMGLLSWKMKRFWDETMAPHWMKVDGKIACAFSTNSLIR